MSLDRTLVLSLARRAALASEQANVQRESMRAALSELLETDLAHSSDPFWLEDSVDDLLGRFPGQTELLTELAATLRATHVVLEIAGIDADPRPLADHIAQCWRVPVRTVTSDGAPSVRIIVPSKLRSQEPAMTAACEAWSRSRVR